MAYEEEWQGGKIVNARYQGPDHRVISYAGARQGQHPSLVDATLNNVFLDRGRTAARVTMVPAVVDLTSATRESVMDRQPWIYRRMADELQEEGKAAVFGDVREYLYVDARLTLTGSAVAAIALGTDGAWRASDRGLKELAVIGMAGCASLSRSRATPPMSDSTVTRSNWLQGRAGLKSAECWRWIRTTSPDRIAAPARWNWRPARCGR